MDAKKIFFTALVGFFALSASFVLAESFSSPNFKIFDESINFGAESSYSQNFKAQNSLGETAQGGSSSQNFSARGGFLQRLEVAEPASQQSLPQGSGGGVVPTSFLTSLNPDTIPPTTSDILIVPTSDSTIRATWRTNEGSASELFYGKTQSFELGSVKNPEFLTSHAFFIANLKPETLYYFQITASDKAGNKAKSDIFSASTLKDEEPPANISNLTVIIRDSALLLKWKNPLDSDFAGVIIIRKIGSFAKNIQDGDKVFEGNAAQYLDQRLINDTTYFYTIFTADIFNNISSGAIIKGKPRKFERKEEKIQIPEKIEQEPQLPEIKPPPEEIEEKIETPEEVFEPYYFPTITLPPFPSEVELRREPSKTPETPEFSEIELRRTPQEVKLPYLFQNFEFFIKTASAVVNFNKLITDATIQQNTIIPNEITTVKDSTLTIAINKDKLRKTAQSIVATLNNSAYMLGFDEKDQSYKTTISAPSAKGKYPLEILIIYTDGSSERIKANVLVDPYGYVYSLIDNQQLRIKDAVVTLYWFNQEKKAFEVWLAQKYGQTNPQITNESGEFAFFVPEGKYYLTASKDGYLQAKTKVFEVMKDVVNINIELKKEAGALINVNENSIAKLFSALLKSNLLPLLIITFGIIILLIFLNIIRKIFK